MKKGMGVFLAVCFLLWGGLAFAENDLQTMLMQKEQLEAQLAQLETEIARAREDDVVALAVEEIKQYWTAKYTEHNQGNGYLGIRFTRVVYVKDALALLQAEAFENMVCFVEFMLLTDYYESAPYYQHVGLNECVAFYHDGTFEVLGKNPLEMYRARTYSSDYSGIIAAISDRGAEFNADYMLLQK